MGNSDRGTTHTAPKPEGPTQFCLSTSHPTLDIGRNLFWNISSELSTGVPRS